jgi:hypothetical protein
MRSSSARIVTAFAAGAVVLATLALSALNQGPVTIGGAKIMDLATGDDLVADRTLSQPDPHRDEVARRLSEQALARYPYDTSALLRLAYIDRAGSDRLGPDGVAALKRSYALVPFDHYVAFWRIRFALENWAELPLDLKEAVRQEEVAVESQPGHRDNLRKTLSAVPPGPGGVVAGFWIARLDRGRP